MILSINILLYYIVKVCIFKYKILLSLEEFEWKLFKTETGLPVITYNFPGNTFKY